MSESLWMLHIQGPDDVVAAPSLLDAETVCAELNKFWSEHTKTRRAEIADEGGNPDYYPEITVVVARWDSSAKAHAKSVDKYWPEYEAWMKKLAASQVAGGDANG